MNQDIAEPILWYDGDPIEKAWLCLVVMQDGVYKINVGNKLTRSFTDADLPDNLKEVLSIVKTYGEVTGFKAPSFPTIYAIPKHLPEEYLEIGWPLDVKGHYMVVIKKNHLAYLKGEETIHHG